MSAELLREAASELEGRRICCDGLSLTGNHENDCIVVRLRTASTLPVNEEAERVAFEAFVGEDFDLRRKANGQYQRTETYCTFAGWLARAEVGRDGNGR